MNISVIGTGYVGLTAGLCFADFGNDVVCMDINADKIDSLNSGIVPIYEPGLELLLKRNLQSKRIRFSDDAKFAIEHGDVIFIGVCTPESENGEADLRCVYNVAESIGKYMNKNTVVVDKSTVPVGTSRAVHSIIQKQLEIRDQSFEFDVVSNPEFMREGKAVNDFTNPDRIVVGLNTDFAREKMMALYSVYNRSNKPIIITTPETAEMIKYASNAFLATKIAFINEIANLCENVGANVLDVSKALGLDGRISPKFLHAGPGYGGSCFPKDTKALVSIAEKYNSRVSIVERVIEANENQKVLAAHKIIRAFPNGGSIAVLGLSFKPDTDDIRESPALTIINELAITNKFNLVLYDPQAIKNAKIELESKKYSNIRWAKDAYDAMSNADAIAVVTEWSEFRGLDFIKVKEKMKGNTIFDFRNIYSANDINEMGLIHIGMGV